MSDQLYSILSLCGIASVVLFVTGFSTQVVAILRVRRQFRDKGFLQRPTGFEWINFLRRKHYDLFKDSVARFFFIITRWCVIGMALTLLTALLLIIVTFSLEAVSP